MFNVYYWSSSYFKCKACKEEAKEASEMLRREKFIRKFSILKAGGYLLRRKYWHNFGYDVLTTAQR